MFIRHSLSRLTRPIYSARAAESIGPRRSKNDYTVHPLSVLSHMRILHVTQTMDPAWGGPPAVVMRLAGAQAMAGHTVSVISDAAPGREKAVADSLRNVPGVDRVSFSDVPLGLGWNATFKKAGIS